MKKIIFFAAALAAIAACTKDKEQQSGTFEKGQKVILKINAPTSTKVTSADDGTNINFTWAEGDVIKVTAGGSDAEFTLKTGAGESSATFEGEMPAGGSTFDVQYPCSTPDLSSQTYSSTEAIPHDKMLLKATGCSISNPSFSLTAQNAVLQLNLWGTDQTIGKIEVKDASSNTYSLGISPAVTLPTSSGAAKAFYVVVPAGSYKFSAKVFDDNSCTVGNFEPSTAPTFTANQVLNMPAKEVKKVQYGITYIVDSSEAGEFSDVPSEAFEEDFLNINFNYYDGWFFKFFEVKKQSGGDVDCDFDEFSESPLCVFSMPDEAVIVKAICMEDLISVNPTSSRIGLNGGPVTFTVTSNFEWCLDDDYGCTFTRTFGGTKGSTTNTQVTVTIPSGGSQGHSFDFTFANLTKTAPNATLCVEYDDI